MIKCSPFEAEKDENQAFVRQNLHNYYDKFKHRKPNLNIGDTVRISIEKGKFAKGYDPRFAEEVYKILNINTNLPFPVYVLTNFKGDEELEGNFYEFELVKVNQEFFKIKKFERT